MKYPPVCSAHWEGAVGQWLRGQLDARGIDAPAYGRYVLSLLTRPLDPADLSPSPIGNKTWERRSQSDWPPVKIEALKRSAAVQCLINASDDQSSGIEQLVDELCSKLKEVEEVNAQNGKRELQAMKTNRRERSRPLSPAEMARLYYAAFPALVPSTSAPVVNTSSASSLPPSSSGLPSNSHKNKEVFSYRHGSGNKEFSRPKKYVTKERRNTIHSHRSHNRGNKHRNFHHKSHDQTEELPEWVNDGDVWDIESHDPIQEYIKVATTDEGYNTCDNTIVNEISNSKRLYERDPEFFLNLEGENVLYSKHWITDDILKSPQKSPAEEESMAKFKAKFDRSLEALWPKEQNNNIDYELPMDFNDLTSSPSDRMFDCYSADKPLPLSLTSSIWSNNDSKSDWENGELVMMNTNEESHPRRFVPELNSLTVNDKQNNSWQNDAELYNKESMEVIYNKLKPLNLDDTDEASYEIKRSSWKVNSFGAPSIKWTDDVIGEPYSFSFDLHPPPVGTPARSFNILNHNSLCSSFTEVVPKAPSGFVGDNLLRKTNINLKLEMAKPLNATEVNEKDEEDLLTSMRTHFRPIKNDAVESTQAPVNYADGMTFPVVSDLDCIKFRRSSSGHMFLDSENEPPKQYMEYRKQGIDYTRLDICPSSVCSDDGMSSTDLVLKFRVCQTEKAIQTEDPDMINANKIPTPEKKCFTDPQDFPSESSNSSISPKVNTSKVDGNVDTEGELEALNFNWVQCEECKLNNQWIGNNWHPVKLNFSKIWSLGDNFCKTCTEEQTKAKSKRRNSGKNKAFEEDSAREWDELLSDLRYIHDLKSENDWQDESASPSENCYIAPSEISFHASDGNFIRSALMSQKSESNIIDDVKAWLVDTGEKIETNTVGKILDQSVILYSNVEPHCEACAEDSFQAKDLEGAWRMDRKRRHSAVNGGRVKGVGKLRCTLPIPGSARAPRPLHLPLLPTADRPLTR